MFKLSMVILLLTVLLMSAIGAMMALGHATPLPEEVAALHLDDGCERPCWLGITPGKTTFAEAQKIISDVYHQEKPIEFTWEGGSTTITIASGFSFKIGLYGWYSIVEGITLTPLATNKVTLAYVTSLLGPPQWLDMNLSSDWWQTPIDDAEIPSELVERHVGSYILLRRKIPKSYPVASISLSFKDHFKPIGGAHTWRGFNAGYLEQIWPYWVKGGGNPSPTPSPMPSPTPTVSPTPRGKLDFLK